MAAPDVVNVTLFAPFRARACFRCDVTIEMDLPNGDLKVRMLYSVQTLGHHEHPEEGVCARRRRLQCLPYGGSAKLKKVCQRRRVEVWKDANSFWAGNSGGPIRNRRSLYSW